MELLRKFSLEAVSKHVLGSFPIRNVNSERSSGDATDSSCVQDIVDPPPDFTTQLRKLIS